FDDHVLQGHRVGDRSPRFRHMPRVPLNRHARTIRQPAARIVLSGRGGAWLCARGASLTIPRSTEGSASTMAAIPEKYMDLFTAKKPLANLATLMPDGSPQ